MKKILFALLAIFCIYGQALAELNNLTWAVFPVEKYEHMANEKAQRYEKEGQLKAIGRFYISLERKKIVFEGLRVKDENERIFEFTHEEFEIQKVIKLDNENYTFEGTRSGVYKRLVTGTLQLEKSALAGKVVGFAMTETGTVYQGTMNRYNILSSQTGKSIQQKFQAIDFGDYYAALGDESIKY
jgi:hypothetical protein